MMNSQSHSPILEDDAFLEDALGHADGPALLMSLIHLTGDMSLLDGPIRPRPVVPGGHLAKRLSPEEFDEVRRRVMAALKQGRDRKPVDSDIFDAATIKRMMDFFVGAPVPEDYVPLVLEELNLDGADARAVPSDTSMRPQRSGGFHVVIIGAGMSGILAGIRLKQAGIDFTIVEKNHDVGGTWLQNSYPGCRVDIPSHFYCYSFEPNYDWSQHFCAQPELLQYFRACAEKYDLLPHIRFGCEVIEAKQDGSTWTVTYRDKTGSIVALAGNAVIAAAGQLNRPKIPQIRGLENFGGTIMHTGEWDQHYDYSGKRVAVIGTGASSYQLVPELAKEVQSLTIFQRSPSWMVPSPHYRAEITAQKRWLLKHLPFYARWYRFLIFWNYADAMLPSLTVDPAWPHQDRSINQANDRLRADITAYVREQLGEDEDLLAMILPDFPPGVRRFMRDDGKWFEAMKQPHVELVTGGVSEIRPEGVVDSQGRLFPVDLIAFATGFDATNFLGSMVVRGRDGQVLSDVWKDDPHAYLGITVPGFSNFFCMYGPGTNLGHGGSIIFQAECQIRFIVGTIQEISGQSSAGYECDVASFRDYADAQDDRLAQLIWSHGSVQSWYKNSAGVVVTNSPWRLVDYWRWTKNRQFERPAAL